MNYFEWMAQEAELTSEALTVRAQALPPNDRDNLLHEAFFPRQDVESTTLSQITTVDFRPASDRREWNVRGRLIPMKTPDLASLEMIPVEDYFKIEEYELQKLFERTAGNEQLFRNLVGVSIPTRVDSLVNANRRRLEFDAFQAWSQGTITVMNPQLGGTATVSYGFDTARYQTAATAWNDAGVNAYEELLAWIEDGVDAIGGPVIGMVCKRPLYRAIQEDAPSETGLMLTRGQFEDQLSADLGFDFRFYIIEHRLDKFNDAGLTTTRTAVWPDEVAALVPAGVSVGNMAYAPIYRTNALAANAGMDEIDVRGMSVFREVSNGGRELTVECQVNAFPIPDEQRIWVIDAGV